MSTSVKVGKRPKVVDLSICPKCKIKHPDPTLFECPTICPHCFQTSNRSRQLAECNAKKTKEKLKMSNKLYLSVDIEKTGPRFQDHIIMIGTCLGDKDGGIIETKAFCGPVPTDDEFEDNCLKEFWTQREVKPILERIRKESQSGSLVGRFMEYFWSLETRFGPFGGSDAIASLIVLCDNPAYDISNIDAVLCREGISEYPFRYTRSGHYLYVENPYDGLNLLSKRKQRIIREMTNAVAPPHDHWAENDATRLYWTKICERRFLESQRGPESDLPSEQPLKSDEDEQSLLRKEVESSVATDEVTSKAQVAGNSNVHAAVEVPQSAPVPAPVQQSIPIHENLAPRFIDFDANLLHDEFAANHMAILEAAVAVGVSHVVVPGVGIEESAQALQLAERDVRVLATAGVHPYSARAPCGSPQLNQLRELAQSPHCRAVGECGLDYSEGFPDREFQLDWFRSQVQLACELSKPLFLHERMSGDDFLNTLKSCGFGPAVAVSGEQGGGNDNVCRPVPCCVHCFTGTTDQLKTFLRWNFMIGLTGHVFSLDEAVLVEWLRLITLDRLVIETDCPYMGWKGCRKGEKSKKTSKYPNVPTSLPLIAEHIARVGGFSVAEVAERTSANALNFLSPSSQLHIVTER